MNLVFKKTIGVIFLFVVSLKGEGVFFDWGIRTSASTTSPAYTPIAHPGGAEWGVDWSGYVGPNGLFTTRARDGLPTGIMLKTGTDPLSDTYTLNYAVNHYPSLGYVMADFEEGTVLDEPKMKAMVDKVRSSSNPKVTEAWVGNYGYGPANVDPSQHYPWIVDQSGRAQVFYATGSTLSLPDCYSYSFMNTHASSGIWGANTSPNSRSGLFFGSLERFSANKRSLPFYKRIIPFVAVAWPWEGYTTIVPEKADFLALIRHYRMRGADGIYRLANSIGYDEKRTTVGQEGEAIGSYFIPRGSWLLSYSDDQCRKDIVDAWKTLDASFGNKVPSFLNLNSTKTTGLEWSAVRYGNSVTALVSNLNANSTLSATYPRGAGLPSTSTGVAPNTHQTFTYTITNEFENPNFNSNISSWYTLGTGKWSSNQGVSGGGCLQLSGSYYAAQYNNAPCKTERATAMTMTFSAKGNVDGSCISVSYYYLDGNNKVIGDVNILSNQKLTTAHQTYTILFTTPNNTEIKSIQPIIYNGRYGTNPGDIIYIDDIVIRFQ